MTTHHRYDLDTQLLHVECDLDTTAIRLLSAGQHYGTYETLSYRSAVEATTQTVIIPVPHSLLALQDLSMELIGTQSANRIAISSATVPEESLASSADETAEETADEKVKEDVADQSYTAQEAPSRSEQLQQWLAGKPAENMDQWVKAYSIAADWQTLATQNFETFVRALFLLILRREPSSETLEFYVQKFGAQADASGALRRIIKSDESKALHASEQHPNPATGAMVQQLITAQTNG